MTSVADWQNMCPVLGRPREDNLWMLTSGILVISMNAAFGLLEAGCVQSRNVLNILMKNLTDLTLGGFAWWAFGFRIAYAQPNDNWPVSIKDESFWFFHWTFAATASTIDSGTVAERINFFAYCIISSVTTGFVYPVVVRLAWAPDGWLHKQGFHDYAGSACVHLLGGTSSFILCKVLGPRIGRFTDYKPNSYIPPGLHKLCCRRSLDPDYYLLPPGIPPLPPVSDAVSLIWGVFFLWIGWYGFNPGAVPNIEAGGTYVVAHIMMNTTMGALGGGAAGFLCMLLFRGAKVSAEGLSVGILAGLVSITAGGPYFGNGTAFLTGFMGSVIAFNVCKLLQYLRMDDVVSAIPVHGACGLFGTIMVGLVSEPWSCIEGGPVGIFFAHTPEASKAAWKLLRVQIMGCLMIMTWTAVVTFGVAVIINQIRGLRLRLDRTTELLGLDEAEHGMAHDSFDFECTIKEMLESIAEGSGTSEELLDACGYAIRCLSQPEEMQLAKLKRLEHASNMTLHVTVVSATGLSVLPQAGAKVSVEIVCLGNCAGDPSESTDSTRLWQFFTARETNLALPDIDLTWNSTLAFEKFYLPTGSEDKIFTMCTVLEGGAPIAQARLGLSTILWTVDETDRSMEHDVLLPLLPVKNNKHVSEEAALSLHLRVHAAGNVSQYLHRVSKWNSESTRAARKLLSKRGSTLSCPGSLPGTQASGQHRKSDIPDRRALVNNQTKQEPTSSDRSQTVDIPSIYELEGRVRALEHGLFNLEDVADASFATSGQLSTVWLTADRAKAVELLMSGGTSPEDVLLAPPSMDEWSHILKTESVRNYVLDARMAALTKHCREGPYQRGAGCDKRDQKSDDEMEFL